MEEVLNPANLDLRLVRIDGVLLMAYFPNLRILQEAGGNWKTRQSTPNRSTT
jgi:hypothetical protein